MKEGVAECEVLRADCVPVDLPCGMTRYPNDIRYARRRFEDTP